MVVATFEAHLAYLWIGVCFIVSNALIICGADKNRERIHIAKRQELKNRQRDAMLAGRPVQTVIEEAEPLIRQSSSRISCVREIPDLQSLDKFRRQRHEQQRCEIPNFNNVALESTQSRLSMELSELHDLMGTTPTTPSMKCSGLHDDTITAVVVDENEFYDVSLSSSS